MPEALLKLLALELGLIGQWNQEWRIKTTSNKMSN